MVDYNKNAAELTSMFEGNASDGYTYLYWFTVADYGIDGGAQFTFDQNGSLLDTNANFDSLGMTVQTNWAFGSDAYVELKFEEEGGSHREFRMNATDKEGRQFGNAVCTDEYHHLSDGQHEFVLTSIRVHKGVGTYDLDIGDLNEYKYIWDYSSLMENQEFTVEVSSVELSHQGEFVSAGDVIDIVAHAVGNHPIDEEVEICFRPANEDIKPIVHWVSLYYDWLTGAYRGQWTIEPDRYSCEWYVSSLSFVSRDTGEIYYADAPINYPDYIKVKNGEAYSDPVEDVEFRFYQFDPLTWDLEVKDRVIVENAPRRTTLKDLGISLPEIASPVEGMNPSGWSLRGNYEVSEDSELVIRYQEDFYPIYDKVPYHSTFYYRDANGNLGEEEYKGLAEQGATFGMLYNQIQTFRVDDMCDDYTFTGWEIGEGGYRENDKNIPVWIYWVPDYSVYADYSEAKMIRLRSRYYDGEAIDRLQSNTEVDSKPLMVDLDATYEDIIAAADEIEPDETYAGLQFDHWEYEEPDTLRTNPEEYEPINSIIRNAVYDKGLVRIQLYKDSLDDENLIYRKYEILEGGTEYTVPSVIDGYAIENIDRRGELKEVNSFTVGTTFGDNDLYGVIDPAADVTSVDSSDTSDPDFPAVRPDEDTINNTITGIENSGNGETVEVTMDDATILPREILETAKGKDVTIALQMNGYTWTINGKDIAASQLGDINMGIMLDSGAIYSSVVSELAGNNPTRELSLAHAGEFGFRADLTIHIGAENAGKVGNLYYYNSDNKMVFMSDPTVGEDGSITFPFSHASNYVVVLTDAPESSTNSIFQSSILYIAVIVVAVVVVVIGIIGYVLRKRFKA